MQTDTVSIPLSMPGPEFWVEVIRSTITLAFVAGLVAVFYLAVKWLAGPRARTSASWHWRFAAGGVVGLIVLLLAQTPIEAFLSFIIQPLNRLTETTAPDWPREALTGLFRSVILTLLLVLLIQLIGWLYWRWEWRLQSFRARSENSAYWTVIGTMLLRLFRVGSIFFLLLASLPVYLNFFPRSRRLLTGVVDFLGNPLRTIVQSVVDYLPDLGYLAIILILGRYLLRAIRYLFDSLENGELKIQGFHPDWAMPSYRLARTLFLLFLLMVSYPYLPGSKSQFFQGFSVFVGALITFGSSGAIGNIVAGTLLTYTRAFRMGDMVNIGDCTGVVIDKSLLVTRVRTSKNEEVSIPNGNVLSGSVLNYSSRAASEGVVLTVAAGIGYDVDWRTVHRLMIDGALATPYILHNPPPKVWQSSLGDYAVNYELRALTDNALEMWDTYSLLRQNVLDAFNKAGVEIMTPSIFAHRDASGLAVPVEQFPNREEPKGIAVSLRTPS